MKGLEWTWGNKPLSSLLPNGGRVGIPKKFLWYLLHLTCGWVNPEVLCPHSCWGWWGNRLAGRQHWGWTTGYREITTVPLPFTNRVSPVLAMPPLQGGLWIKGKSIWVFDISLTFNARTEWCIYTWRGRSWHWCLKSHSHSGG